MVGQGVVVWSKVAEILGARWPRSLGLANDSHQIRFNSSHLIPVWKVYNSFFILYFNSNYAPAQWLERLPNSMDVLSSNPSAGFKCF